MIPPHPYIPCRRTKVEVMARINDKTPEQLAFIIEDELRVLTENP